MKLAIVVPWYSKSGGAEIAAYNYAVNLADCGIEVEVLTTCCKGPFHDWDKNSYKEGKQKDSNVVVRRFLTDSRDKEVFEELNLEMQKEGGLPEKEEKSFLKEGINSSNLYKFIEENKDQYDWFIFLPYLYGTTYFGSKIIPEKTIIIPCLHDEPNAYMKIYKKMFSDVKYNLFLSNAEFDLFKSIYGLSNGEVLGLGVVDENVELNFREKNDIKNDYILFLGRKVKGKGVDLLVDYFKKYKEENPDLKLDLVIAGGGELDFSGLERDDVKDMGFISDKEKISAINECLFLCNPSFFESFSIVIMEAWLKSKPVLVNKKCSVTYRHCLDSDGGLYFDNYKVFKYCLNFFLANPKLREILGRNGKKYVKENYSWPVITEKFINILERL